MQKEIITIFQAGSLNIPFIQISKAFERKYPEYLVKMENSGSIKAAKKIYEEGKKADVIASADYKVIDNLLIPKYAKFNAQFSTNEMVIAYTKKSTYANEITEKNWTDILLKEEVKIAHTNPNLDPCGYRSIFLVKLAENFYNIPNFYNELLGYGEFYKNKSENKNKIIVKNSESELLELIQRNKYDYLFIYKSVAKQHKLEYLCLPKEISLIDNEKESFYKTVSFKIEGKNKGSYLRKSAEAMIYGITLIQNDKISKNKEGAIKFVNFVLSKEGQKIMFKNGQDVINPAIITGDSSILLK